MSEFVVCLFERSPAMTERCQTKFTEKFDNYNYIIYLGILCTSVAVLLFYRYAIHSCIFVRSPLRKLTNPLLLWLQASLRDDSI